MVLVLFFPGVDKLGSATLSPLPPTKKNPKRKKEIIPIPRFMVKLTMQMQKGSATHPNIIPSWWT
jgi:hypothetical protein